METIDTVREMQKLADDWRVDGHRITLVPTMGALHAGHLAIVNEAAEAGDRVIVSIFVNPTQFAPGEDFQRYPRDLDGDIEKLSDSSVSTVFAPAMESMFPKIPVMTSVEVDRLTNHLCGPHRPGHFAGVTTIVARLFNICKPHAAFFGLKDIQQFVIVRKMVEDLNIDAEVKGVQTVREPDGLALSSRNVYLSEEERRQATVLSRAVQRACDKMALGERSSSAIEDEMREIIDAAPLAQIQYAEVVEGRTLQRVSQLQPGEPAIAATAVYFGSTRLIDNCYVESFTM